MSSTFTPSTSIDMSKERDWPANLGMLDWDDTSIVFTKRSLIEFLKYTGTTVDTNLNNIAKLPRYAKFGKLTQASHPHNNEDDALSQAPPQARDAQTITSRDAAVPEQEDVQSTTSIKPSRRVRENPGGNSSLANFWDAEEPTEFKPSRRVREGPGGHDSISNIF